MSTFHQTAYLNALREIKRLAEIEDFSPTTLIYLIDTEAHKALTLGGVLGSR
jgi:hypothetical protein